MSGRGGLEIVLDHVTFRYAEMEMGFDLSFAAGSVTAIMGPSGAGKSTLLNLVAGFETPVDGRILIGGEDVTGLPPAVRPVSMVFQENNLFSHLDVAANVGLGRSPALKLSWEDRAAVADALARTGLLGKEKRLPSELSGGERQRVALARVLVRNRPVLLLDEPFASLDAALRREMTGLVGELHFRTGMTILMVTHDVVDARRIADRVVRVEDGHVVGLGTAEEPAPGRRLSGQKRE
ncbi:MAG: thiamine ABC transporter ATP-binding protein [Rhizobiaceae bacterium]